MDLKYIIEISGFLFGIGASWAVASYRISRNEQEHDKDMKNVWEQISKVRDRQENHDKDSSSTRLEIEKEFNKIRVDMADTNGKFNMIMSMLTDIKDEFELFRKEKKG